MIERRTTTSTVRPASSVPVSVRSLAESSRKLSGLASVFYRPGDSGSEFELAPGVFERIDPTAFNDFLRSAADCVCLWNHDVNHLLGRRSAGTLKLSVDAVGLRYAITTPDTQLGHDMATLSTRGDITGSSFSFIADRIRWIDDRGKAIRIIERASLVDVSPVTYPAYGSTTSTVG